MDEREEGEQELSLAACIEALNYSSIIGAGKAALNTGSLVAILSICGAIYGLGQLLE